MIPGNGSDLGTLQRQYASLGIPLDVIATMDALQDNNGYASTVAKYAGPTPYAGGPDGNVIEVLGRYKHAFQVVSSNTASYSVQMEASNDGLNWKSVGTAVTADGFTQATGLFRFVRFSLTAWTISGSPVAGAPNGIYVRYLATV